ncbi:MAG TPA: type III pantothenate kinase [Tepidisphaeraceae bacterium]|jgi:type III pantothenate kinase
MEINLLVVNVGNSRIALGSFIAGDLKTVIRVDSAEPETWPAAIKEIWESIDGRENAAIIGASVNPDRAKEFEETLTHITHQRMAWIGKDIDVPIHVKTEHPLRTGVDRILNIAAAYEQMQKACIVVDVGTAITVDCCNDAGDFLGGSIAPGAKTMLDSLHEKTSQLPQVKLEEPAGPYGRDTKQAMLHGVYHGIRGMVKELAEQYATELGSWPEIIATGGDAKLLFGNWELIHAIVPDLTLYGIALAFVENDLENRNEEKQHSIPVRFERGTGE